MKNSTVTNHLMYSTIVLANFKNKMLSKKIKMSQASNLILLSMTSKKEVALCTHIKSAKFNLQSKSFTDTTYSKGRLPMKLGIQYPQMQPKLVRS